MGFKEGNALYRQGAYEQAASYYVNNIQQQNEFNPYYVNLALALRKVENKVACDQLLKGVLEVLRPGKVEDDLSLVKKSRLVNKKWYAVEYAAWLPKKADPILHYLAVGCRLGLNPCKRFDNDFYLTYHQKKMHHNEIPLLHYLYVGKDQELEIKEKYLNTVSHFSAQLWNGHSVSALQELKMIYNDESSADGARWYAYWHAARWLYFCGDFTKSLSFSNQMQKLIKPGKVSKETLYLKYFCLLKIGRIGEAFTALHDFVQMHPKDADAYFALANSADGDIKRTKLINQAFSIHGFSSICRRDKSQPLSIGNMEGLPVAKVKGAKKVSIVMPIYSAGEQIRIAIESLLAQTYENIEIIAVDDCSPDDTFEVLKALEKEDSRVIAVQPSQNGGAYAARNYGLTFATGDFLTTHDSDDWSHPQKIATQVAYLEKNPDIKGCSVHWIRVQESLAFTQNWRPNNSLTHWSQSSFMFRRDVLETIGEWDHVRIGGDTEYIWRMQAQFGKKSFAKIHAGIPLAFALDEESSLTRTKATHVRTVYFGLRHIYREICAWWHASQKDLHVKDAKTKRVFPAPRSMFERSGEPLVFNTVIAGDFSRLEDCQKTAVFIGKHPQQKVALFHWPSFHKAPEALCNLYFEMLQQGKIEPIVMGQRVEAKFFVVMDKELLNFPLDALPDFFNFNEWVEA